MLQHIVRLCVLEILRSARLEQLEPGSAAPAVRPFQSAETSKLDEGVNPSLPSDLAVHLKIGGVQNMCDV